MNPITEHQEAFEFVEKINKIITSSYSENNKLARKDFKDLKELFETNNQQHTKHRITIPDFEIQELSQGVYELVDINTAIRNQTESGFEINIEAVTISMKSNLTT